MDKVLIHTSPAISLLLEYELEIAQRELDKGNKVFFLYCHGQRENCYANKIHNWNAKFKKRYCYECKSRASQGVKWLETKNDNFIVIDYYEPKPLLKSKIESLMCKIKSCKTEACVKDVVNIDGVDIFQSAHSTMVSSARNSKLSYLADKSTFLYYLEQAIENYYISKSHMKDILPDKVYVFNGRTVWYRPLLRLCQNDNIRVTTYEYPYYGHENYIEVVGTYIHDRKNYSSILKEICNKKHEEMISIGAKWFDNRINDIDQGLLSTFAKHQYKNLLPKEWNKDAFNISLFVSSEFEMTTIEENVNNTPYSQTEAIRRIALEVENADLYVRIHPWLLNKDDGFVNDLFSMSDFDNLTVIGSGEPIHTYKLISHSDLIIVFGSTVGIEASFMGKPVINIGASVSQSFDCMKIIKTHKELMRVIFNIVNGNENDFPAKNKRYEGACYYGFAIQNCGVEAKYLKREGYNKGYMIRDNIKTKVRSNLVFTTYNRTIEAIGRILRVLTNIESFNKVVRSPMKYIKKIHQEPF